MACTNASQARTAVFDTTELAEMIFLELPMRDILRVQQVSKRWAAVVNCSSKLQQALFKQPCTTKALHWEPGSATGNAKRIVTHPVLSEACARSRNGYSCHAIWQLKPGSWLQQLVSQPPLASVYVAIDVDSSQPKRSADFDHEIKVQAQSGRMGVTWGDLIDDMHACEITSQPDTVVIMGSGTWREMKWKEDSAYRDIEVVKEEKDFGPWKFQGNLGGTLTTSVESHARNLSPPDDRFDLKQDP